MHHRMHPALLNPITYICTITQPPPQNPKRTQHIQSMAAVTNIAESRAGGRAGGAAEPVLEANTHTRLDRSLGAFGLLSLLVTVGLGYGGCGGCGWVLIWVGADWVGVVVRAQQAVRADWRARVPLLAGPAMSPSALSASCRLPTSQGPSPLLSIDLPHACRNHQPTIQPTPSIRVWRSPPWRPACCPTTLLALRC